MAGGEEGGEDAYISTKYYFIFLKMCTYLNFFLEIYKKGDAGSVIHGYNPRSLSKLILTT